MRKTADQRTVSRVDTGWTARHSAHQASLAVLAAIAVGLGGCAVFPAVGPDARDVVNLPSNNPNDGYSLVKVTPDVLHILATAPRDGFGNTFANHAKVAPQYIGVGDTVQVTIWDIAGLFAPSSSQSAGGQQAQGGPPGTIPTPPPSGTGSTFPGSAVPLQIVDQNGNITIPYAGKVHAAGLSTAQLQDRITGALKKVTYQPQVLVYVSQTVSNLVTVSGDVTHPGRVALPLNGLRMLDAIALSGGPTAPSADTSVRLTRHGVTHTTRLEQVVRYPDENIFMESDDLLYLDREPQSVVVLGAVNFAATGASMHVLFNKPELTLAEALAGSGGLADVEADPYGVFVFRYEPSAAIGPLGLSTPAAADPKAVVPVIYHVNLKRPEGFFMAQGFEMRDHDVVYIANADTVQLDKMFRQFALIATIPKTGSGTVSSTN